MFFLPSNQRSLTPSGILSLGAATKAHLMDSRVISSCRTDISGETQIRGDVFEAYLQSSNGVHVDMDFDVCVRVGPTLLDHRGDLR